MPVAGTAALPVREEQVRARMALRKLAADRLAAGPDAASRRDTGVVMFPALPDVYASGAVRVIEPCRVHAAPPVAWIMRPLPIHLPFDRVQERGERWLAFGQQLAHVRTVVAGPVVPSLNVSGHKRHLTLKLTSAASGPVRVASQDSRMRSVFTAWRQVPRIALPASRNAQVGAAIPARRMAGRGARAGAGGAAREVAGLGSESFD